ncbi:competence protein ComEA [Gammaproteobacteria bacterium]
MKNLRIWLSVFLLVVFSGLAYGAPVDINTADAAALANAIVGVGPKKAEAIVTYRQQNGPFTTVDDLMKVKGIGQKTLDNNRANLTVGSVPASAAPAKPLAAEPAKPAAVAPAKPAAMVPAKPTTPATK